MIGLEFPHPLGLIYRPSLARRFDSKCSCSDQVPAVLQMAAFPETLEQPPFLDIQLTRMLVIESKETILDQLGRAPESKPT